MLATSGGSEGPVGDEQRNHAVELLSAALKMLDAYGESPDVGARLQGIIDSLSEPLQESISGAA
jgi:hypothetical protein